MTDRFKIFRTLLTTLAAAGVALGSAQSASADQPWPDPNVPPYWEQGQNAEGTGPAPLPDYQIPYWKEGEDAGGTGNAPQPDQIPYFDEGQDAGAY
jgi:hypothetical protein